MPCGPTAKLALERGFWNRLLGLGANKTLTVRNVKQLAASGPTNVELTTADARALITLAVGSMSAAELWFTGINPDAIEIPQVPQPSFDPLYSSEEETYVNVGIIINDPEKPNSDLPLTFSVPKLPRVGELLDFIENNIAEACNNLSSPTFNCHKAEEIFKKYAGRNAGQFVPWQLWKEVQEIAEGL